MKASEAKTICLSIEAKDYFFNKIIEEIKQEAIKGKYGMAIHETDVDKFGERLISLGYIIKERNKYIRPNCKLLIWDEGEVTLVEPKQ